MVCIIKLGNIVEGLIEVVTFGRGKDIATWVAKKLGYADCGCDKRKEYLNSLLGCKQKAIQLNIKKKK
jgi:hypothetical protein